MVKDFNEDLDSYISKRRSKQPAKIPKRKEQKIKSTKAPTIVEEEVHVEYDESSPFSRWFSNFFGPKKRSRFQEEDVEDLDPEDEKELEKMEQNIEEMDEDIQDLEKKRDGSFSKFLKSMRFARNRKKMPSEDDLLDAAAPVLDPEVKEVLKIMHKWLERLPNPDLRQFKTSQDFIKYKTLLEKYELIKKK